MHCNCTCNYDYYAATTATTTTTTATTTSTTPEKKSGWCNNFGQYCIDKSGRTVKKENRGWLGINYWHVG